MSKGSTSFKERREYTRRPFTEPVRYFIAVSKTGEILKIYSDGVSVDISEGGLGMITPFSLQAGDLLCFEHDIKIKDNMLAWASIVRWVKETENNRYRVGLKFFWDVL